MCFSVSKIREDGEQMPWHQLIGPDELKKMNVRISSRFVQSLSIDKEESWVDDDLLSY